MLILQSGNAIAVRQNSNLVSIAVFILIVLSILIALRYVFASLGRSFMEAMRGKRRTSLDSALLKISGIRMGLNRNEIDFLDNFCRTCGIVELPLISSTEYCISTPLKLIYRKICNREKNVPALQTENDKLMLFTIIHKIENAKRNLTMITNSSVFREGLAVMYSGADGIRYPSAILKNDEEGMILAIASDKNGVKIKPAPLSKINIYLELKTGIAYHIEARIIRYQVRRRFEEMVVMHTNNIQSMLQRKFKRISVSLPCTFHAVQISEGQTANEKRYTPKERSYTGTINDISAGGCKLKTVLPIKAGQYMQIDVQLKGERTDNIIGTVVRARKNEDTRDVVLHIRFVRMKKYARNTIFALTYDYN